MRCLQYMEGISPPFLSSQGKVKKSFTFTKYLFKKWNLSVQYSDKPLIYILTETSIQIIFLMPAMPHCMDVCTISSRNHDWVLTSSKLKRTSWKNDPLSHRVPILINIWKTLSEMFDLQENLANDNSCSNPKIAMCVVGPRHYIKSPIFQKYQRA